MNSFNKSITLIGMPGAGKSTIGLILAKELARDFIDTDLLIQLSEGKTLQDVLNEFGYEKLRAIEHETLLSINCSNHVIATGGSAVYSEAGMAHLKTLGPIIFLDVTPDELLKRIHNFESRGIARRPGQSFADLYDERRSMYQHYADITIICEHKSHNDIVQEIIFEEAETFAEMDA